MLSPQRSFLTFHTQLHLFLMFNKAEIYLMFKARQGVIIKTYLLLSAFSHQPVNATVYFPVWENVKLNRLSAWKLPVFFLQKSMFHPRSLSSSLNAMRLIFLERGESTGSGRNRDWLKWKNWCKKKWKARERGRREQEGELGRILMHHDCISS